MIRIHQGNSLSQVTGASDEVLKALRYSLSVKIAEPGEKWDGWKRLMQRNGVFLSGLQDEVERLLRKYGQDFLVEDERVVPEHADPYGHDISLRGYQQEIVDMALTMERGVMDAPPRSGKTRMAAAIVDRRGQPTLWTAPTKAIVKQTIQSLEKLIPGMHPVSLVGGWPKPPKRQRALLAAPVVVTTAAGAANFPERFYRTRDLLIIDEFHHAAADTWHEINRKARGVYYRYGLTGTHFRSDEQTELLMHGILSDVIGKVTVPFLIDNGYLARPTFLFHPVAGYMRGNARDDYDRLITNHEVRNSWIAYYASQLSNEGRRVLVLVNRIAHGEVLAGLIDQSVFVQGEDGDGVGDAIADFTAGKVRVLIGTSVLGEGVDLPTADCLIYAKAGAAPVTVTQDVFRVLTKSSEDSRADALIIDFADRYNRVFLDQATARGRLYASQPAFEVGLIGDSLERRILV